MGADLRETRRSDGARKASLRECRSLCRAGILDARFSARVKHADLCRIACCRLVRARRGATRQQSLDPAALTLHRAEVAPLSGTARERRVKFQTCSGGL